MAGLRVPIESHLLQAFVSEPIKPFVDHVISYGAEFFYISQSDKGGLVFGGHIDGFNSYTQRGQFPKVQSVVESAIALMPSISRLRLLRHWAGIQDMTPDGSPFICRTPVRHLYFNGGWCYQGFQGDACVRLVLRPHDCARRGACAESVLRLSNASRRGRRAQRGWGGQLDLQAMSNRH